MDYTIHECVHCHERTNGKYCSYCKTKEDRIKMDKENEAHFKDKNVSFEHNCPDYSFKVVHECLPGCDMHEEVSDEKEFFDSIDIKRADYRTKALEEND